MQYHNVTDMSNIFLIVGLGNPGLRYKKTRHNIGFRVLDEFQKENNFPKFKLNTKFRSEVSEGEISGKKIVLAKPQTFMNKSGLSVRELSSLLSRELSSLQLIVIHDDFDLPFGEVKISENIGSAGHHGIQSIIDSLGTQNFKRIRIGTRPKSESGNGLPLTTFRAEDFVLKKFSKTEEKLLAEIFERTACLLNQSFGG